MEQEEDILSKSQKVQRAEMAKRKAEQEIEELEEKLEDAIMSVSLKQVLFDPQGRLTVTAGSVL